MSNAVNDARVYTDLGALTQLQGQAKQNSGAAAKVVAKQFEALFVQMMLKSMRDATPQNGVFDSDQSRTYQDLFDKQIAMDIAQRGDLGIADLVLSQTAPDSQAGSGQGGDTQGDGSEVFQPRYWNGLRSGTVDSIARGGNATASGRNGIAATAADPAAGSDAMPLPDRFDSPADFVRQLSPYAEAAGRQLGLSPDLLLAQAALETGWGQRLIRNRSGENSHNLFGIKAGSEWNGSSVSVSTMEYDRGVAERVTAPFRAYGSYAESFQDYVDFLRSHPRYSSALQNTQDPGAYIGALHRAGYATDPAYPGKVLGLMRNEIQELKVAQARALTDG